MTTATIENETLLTIASHNGTITIQNPETGGHRTFLVRTQAEDAKFAPGQRVVALLSGPDNETDYTPFGFVRDNGTIAVFRKRQGGVFDRYADILTRLEAYVESSRLEVLFEGRCRRCNRKLTTPESVKSGIGPVCAGK